VYWETTTSSALEDYRAVEGVMIAHSGRSAATLFRFGEAAMSHTKTRMEEAWSIEEVAFNVPGLSTDCFIRRDLWRRGRRARGYGARRAGHSSDDNCLCFLAAGHQRALPLLHGAAGEDPASSTGKEGGQPVHDLPSGPPPPRSAAVRPTAGRGDRDGDGATATAPSAAASARRNRPCTAYDM
jgi:hypothetical protein